MSVSRYRSSGFSAYGDVSWSSGGDCWDSSYASIQGSKGTKKGNNANTNAVDSVYFSMSLLLDCTGGTTTRLSVYDDGWWSEDGPSPTDSVSVVVDSKLLKGSLSKTTVASVSVETCTEVYVPEEDYYYSECVLDDYGQKAVTIAATLTAVAGSTAYNSKQTYSGRSDYGRYRSTSSGSYRDASVTGLTATIDGYGTFSLADVPADSVWYAYGTIAKTTSADMSFFKF